MSLCLSVIIPVFNVKDYLTTCVNSILSQNVESMEVILVDDGSTDGSGDICDKFALSDKRVKVIHKPNGGVNTARNVGLDAALGEYITMVDGDDYLKPGTLGPATHYIKNNLVDLIQYPEIFVQNGKETLRNRYPQQTQVLINTREMISALLDPNELFPGELWGKIYKRYLWEDLRLREDMQFCEDAYIFPNIMSRCKAIAQIIDGGYCYVIRNGSATHSDFTPKKRLDCFRFKAVFYETALKYHVHTGFWWNESCFSAIDAWTYWGESEEIKYFLTQLQKTKRDVTKVPTKKKLVKAARIFSPLSIAKINRVRAQIMEMFHRFFTDLCL